jgi:hypothetical protein
MNQLERVNTKDGIKMLVPRKRRSNRHIKRRLHKIKGKLWECNISRVSER